jgi:hypothetical protein
MEEELIQYLLSIGALQFAFVDDHGEKVYRLTPEAKELVPTLYEEHIKDFNSTVFSLWNKGIIDIVFDENGEPLIGPNENSENKKKIKKLDKNEKEVLSEILFLWNKKQEE